MRQWNRNGQGMNNFEYLGFRLNVGSDDYLCDVLGRLDLLGMMLQGRYFLVLLDVHVTQV